MSTVAGEIPHPMPNMERLNRTLTITDWDSLLDHDHDHAFDQQFFESFDRISSVVSLSSSEDDDEDDNDFDDCRVSFASAVSSLRSFSASTATVPAPDYDLWMASPGSISERRKRLLQGMGLAVSATDDKDAAVSKRQQQQPPQPPQPKQGQPLPSTSSPSPSLSPCPFPLLLVRSRSDGDIEPFFTEKQRRKQEMVGSVPMQRRTRTFSAISAPARKLSCSYPDSANAGPSGRSIRHSGMLSSSVLSSSRFEAFFLIKNLDTGKEFIVSECGKDGMWNRLSDLQTGKQLTMEEFEKSVGYSPLVKELMHRENFSRISSSSERKVGGGGGINYSYITRSLRMITKRKGVSLIKSGIRGVAHSMSGLICEKEREAPLPALPPPPLPSAEQKLPGKNSNSNS